MVDPIKLPIPTPPPNVDAYARADTDRNQRLFDWAEAVLKALGLDKAVAAARSIEDLRRIALDVESVADAYTAYQGRLGCHSRASFWASAICAGVMRFASSSLSFRSTLIALRGRQVEPHVCADVILRHALAIGVHDAETVLRIGVALVGGEAKPLQGLGVVLRHPSAIAYMRPRLNCARRRLDRQRGDTTSGLGVVLRHPRPGT